VAAASGRTLPELLDALEHATEAGLVEPVVGRHGRFAFGHALFREARYDALPAGRRMQLHARVATALVPRRSDPTVVAELARHACLGASLGDPALAVDLAEEAGSLSASVGDHVEAAQHLQRALDVIDLAPERDERRRLALTIRLGEAVAPVDMKRGHAILRDAARLARRLGDVDAFADAVCSMTVELGSVSPGRDDPAFVALAEEALSRLGPAETHWRVRLLAVVGVNRALGTQPDRGREEIREAVSVARRSDDPFDLVRASLSLHFALDQLDHEERCSAMRDALEICLHHANGVVTQVAATRVASAQRAIGDLDSMREYHQRAVDAAPTKALGVLQNDALMAFLDGDLALAEQRNARTHEVDVGVGATHLYSGSLAMLIATWRRRSTTRMLEPFVSVPSFQGDGARSLLGFSYLQDGRTDDARALFDAVRIVGFDRLPRGLSRVLALAVWGEVAASLGERGSAETIFGLLDPLAGHLADAAGLVWSSIDQVRARLALALGDPELAESVASSAVEASRQRGTRLFLGRELVVLARARAAIGRDPEQVAAPLTEALAIADATGAALIRADAALLGVSM
jgi:hypothetical protein